MKQIIAKNREEAKTFAEGGSINSQRAAYWREGKRALRFERLPGETEPTWRDGVEGLWWSATETVGHKLGISPIGLRVWDLNFKKSRPRRKNRYFVGTYFEWLR